MLLETNHLGTTGHARLPNWLAIQLHDAFTPSGSFEQYIHANRGVWRALHTC
jgi:hypothetical protein